MNDRIFAVLRPNSEAARQVAALSENSYGSNYSLRDAGGITEIQLAILGERRYLPSGLYR